MLLATRSAVSRTMVPSQARLLGRSFRRCAPRAPVRVYRHLKNKQDSVILLYRTSPTQLTPCFEPEASPLCPTVTLFCAVFAACKTCPFLTDVFPKRSVYSVTLQRMICCFRVLGGVALRTKPARNTRRTLTPTPGVERAEGQPEPPALTLGQPHGGGHREPPPRPGTTAPGRTGGAATAGAARSEETCHPVTHRARLGRSRCPASPWGSLSLLCFFLCF